MAIVFFFCKCAILCLLAFFGCPYRQLHLPQHHFRNVAGGFTKHGDGFDGVEVIHSGEILPAVITTGLNSTASKEHKTDRAFERAFQPDIRIQFVQLFEQASILYGKKLLTVILEIVIHGNFGDLYQVMLKAAMLVQSSEVILQSVQRFGAITLF